MKSIKYIVLLVSLMATISMPVSAISIRGLLGLDEDESETEEAASKDNAKSASQSSQAADENWAKSKPAANSTIDLALVRRLMANIDSTQRSALLADEAVFKQFIQQQANNLSVIAAAQANKVGEDSNTAFLMQRGADNILREIYLNKLIELKLPKDFPSDEQVREYFDNNKDKFVIAERMHVWQVFFPVNDTMDEKAIKQSRKTASAVAEDIKKGKIDFAGAAIKYSKHSPSNANGGYMGLINTADLKPGLKKELLELGERKVSEVLTTDTGLHIVKRGSIVSERKVTLEESRPQIRTLLINQVRAQLRKAIFEQAAKTYPVELSPNKVEEWRLRLKTNLDAPTAKQ
jgi:parvulin-like peptidyl-prolyl isomerase